MYLDSILRWALQYQLLLALIIVGVHTFHIKCAPYKDLYDHQPFMQQLPELTEVSQECK